MRPFTYLPLNKRVLEYLDTPFINDGKPLILENKEHKDKLVVYLKDKGFLNDAYFLEHRVHLDCVTTVGFY